MLKKIAFYTVLFLSTSMMANSTTTNYWQGCGASPAEAKSALAQNIMVKVDVSFSEKETTSLFNGKESVASQTQSSNTQKSTMFLQNIESFKTKNNEYCARVNKEELHTFAKNKLRNLDRDYKISSLNIEDVKTKAKTIDNWLVSLKFLKGLTEVFSDLKVEKINDKIKDLENIRKKLFLQNVIITKTGSMKGHFQLMVDNKIQPFAKKIYLEAKKIHTYSIDGDNICKYTGTFTLKKEKDLEISVNVDKQAYPKFTISANKPDDIKFLFNGQKAQLGKEITVHKCSGTLSYTLEYPNGLPKSVGDEVTLKPGLKYNKFYSFKSYQEIEHLRHLAKYFESGKRIEIGYEYRAIPNNENYKDALNTIKISVVKYKDWLRQGLSIAYSTADGKYLEPQSYGVDVTYLAAFQLTTFGVDKRSFTLFDSFALVPYAGIETGFGILNMHNKNTNKSDRDFNADDKGFAQFVHNYVVAKGLIGFDVIFSKQIAFGLKYSKEINLLKSNNFAFYLNLSL
ncbi:hypothetical protein MNB_SM-3-1013 [hydrothermal vent metagenome]|uniref:Uncharacterized protein n=1 Tax=hydrothermal vent metagenome TaxID=652676 RepID=A0A1W1D4S9_9ZZZZ